MANFFITECSESLGFLLADEILSNGDKCTGLTKNISPLVQYITMYSANFNYMPDNQQDPQAMAYAVEETFHIMRDVHGVILTAANPLFLEDLSANQIQNGIESGLNTIEILIPLLFKYMRKQDEGNIVYVSTGNSVYAPLEQEVIKHLGELREKLRDFGIQVVILDPSDAILEEKNTAHLAYKVVDTAYSNSLPERLTIE